MHPQGTVAHTFLAKERTADNDGCGATRPEASKTGNSSGQTCTCLSELNPENVVLDLRWSASQSNNVPA